MLLIKKGPLCATNLSEDDPQVQLPIFHTSLTAKHSQTRCMSLTSQLNTKYTVQNRSIRGRKVTQSRSLQPLTSYYDAYINNCLMGVALHSLASIVGLFSCSSNFRGLRNSTPHLFCKSRFTWSKQRRLPSTFLFIFHNNRAMWLDDV
jgi:hypothetical protein